MAKITRVCLIGAESTGKSELASSLGAELAAEIVPEFAREYALRVGRALDASDVEPIARGEIACLDRARGPLVILDTDLLSTVVYARHYYQSCHPWIEEAARARLADLYLWLDVDVPFVDDAARDAAADRRVVHERFGSALGEFSARHELIRGTWDERRDRALQIIAGFSRSAG